jgi:ribosome-associated toxin RatA of RatAB toxin-antitoxin module
MTNPLLDTSGLPLFDRIAATLVDAFVKRAEQVYAHD